MTSSTIFIQSLLLLQQKCISDDDINDNDGNDDDDGNDDGNDDDDGNEDDSFDKQLSTGPLLTQSFEVFQNVYRDVGTKKIRYLFFQLKFRASFFTSVSLPLSPVVNLLFFLSGCGNCAPIVFSSSERFLIFLCKENIQGLFLKNGPSSASFTFIFGPFQTNNTNFTTH